MSMPIHVRFHVRWFLPLLAAGALVCMARAQAGQAPDAAHIAQAGNGHGAAPCMACHGKKGAGQDAAGFPRLAGLDKAYLLKQLNDYVSGARSNTIMSPNAKALSVAEREALAAYYSAMPVPDAARHRQAKAPDANGPGAKLAQRGHWDQQVPACVQCHGPHGVGVGAHFPPLAGQPAKYIVDQLKAWKKGNRHNDPLDLMKHVAGALNQKDMQAVAAWFAAQPLDAKGETP